MSVLWSLMPVLWPPGTKPHKKKRKSRMSLECSECEQDLRGGHAAGCSRESKIAARRRRKHVELQSAVVKEALDWYRSHTRPRSLRALYAESKLVAACAALEKFETEDEDT